MEHVMKLLKCFKGLKMAWIFNCGSLACKTFWHSYITHWQDL